MQKSDQPEPDQLSPLLRIRPDQKARVQRIRQLLGAAGIGGYDNGALHPQGTRRHLAGPAEHECTRVRESGAD